MRSRLLAAALAWLLLVRADVFAQDTLNGPIGDNLELAAPDRVNLEGTESDMSPWGADSALPTAPPPQSIRDGLSLEEQKQGVGSYTWTMSPPTHPPSLACEMDNLDDLQKLALLLFYYNTGGTSGGWTVDSGWRESWKENEANLEKTTANNTCNWSDKQLSLRGLPDYCCWFGVTCCLFPFCPSSDLLDRVLCGCHVGSVALLELPNNNLTGSLTAPDSEADTVDLLLYLSCAMARLILNSNHLVGTIPGLFSEFQALEVLSLGNNNLTGSIPMELGNVRQLQELELTNNRLTGVVPQSFCGHVDSYARENMVDMLIRGNLVIADLPRHACHGLVFFAAQVDWQGCWVHSNLLMGSVPSFEAFPNLHILRLMDNLLNGSIPSSIGDSRVLVDLDLSKNFITGSIPEKITNLVYLSSLRLDGNVFLSGTIPPTIFERLLSLSSLSCSHCNLSGTLPDTIGQSYALASLNLLGNSLSGTLPDSISKLYYAQVDLVENFLSCCGVGPVVNGRYESYNFSRPRLPSGIRLSDVFTTPQYRPDVNGNNMLKEMSCPALELYSAVDDLDPYSYAYPTLLEWSIDPEYFLFEGCTCGQGLSLTNSSPVEHEIAFLCLPTPVSAPNYSWVIGAVVPGVILIFMLLLCLPLARKGGRLLFVQAALNLRKRLKGIPMTGTISVVVTDIEGYSDLMQRCPELMTPALLQHNQAVRVCKWDNFGFTVEQEGDSYTLVFYEAMDAVKFCMQAQLLLMEQDWHEALTMEVFPEMIQPPNATPIVSIDSVKGLASKLSQKVGLTNVSPASSGMVPDMSRHVSSAGTPIDSSSASFDSKAVKNLRPSSPPCTNNPLSRGVKSTRALESLDEGAEIPHDPSSMIHSTPGSNPSTKKGPIKGLFRGLRVRMGVATGELLPGGMAQGGEVMERAKVVSDAGAGGQVLMDKRTFNGIKNHLEELGAISHTGVHYKLSSLLPRYFAMCSGKSSRSLAEATVLDMGKYIGVSHESKPPDPQGTLDNINKKDSHTWGQPPSFPREQMKKSWHLSSLLGLNSDTAGDMDVSFNSNRLESHLSALPLTRLMPQNYSPRGGLPTHYSHQSMQLFQILPPALVGRAKVFLNTLVLKDDWVGVSRPYFMAPNVALASLGSSDVVPQKPLPSVTVVHCVVESAKRYATFFPSDCRKVASSCESVIHLTLKHFDDGYLSQAQTKNLTYIVVFKSVETALTWCLVAQECLMYVDWPASALEFWKEEDVKTEEVSSVVLFHGPRMKMGVCEGVPRDIHPDRNGRPVYVATFINLAARIACTAAAGGQIVCDAHLARKAAAAWGEQTEKDAVSFDNCTMGQKSVPLRILGGISRASAGARASVGAGVVHASKLSGSVQDSIHSAVSFATSSCSAGAKTGYSGASTGQTTVSSAGPGPTPTPSKPLASVAHPSGVANIVQLQQQQQLDCSTSIVVPAAGAAVAAAASEPQQQLQTDGGPDAAAVRAASEPWQQQKQPGSGPDATAVAGATSRDPKEQYIELSSICFPLDLASVAPLSKGDSKAHIQQWQQQQQKQEQQEQLSGCLDAAAGEEDAPFDNTAPENPRERHIGQTSICLPKGAPLDSDSVAPLSLEANIVQLQQWRKQQQQQLQQLQHWQQKRKLQQGQLELQRSDGVPDAQAVAAATTSIPGNPREQCIEMSTICAQPKDAHLEVTDSSFSLPHLPSTPELAKPTWNLGDLMSLPSQPISASARSDVSAQTTSSDLIEVTASLPTPTTTPSKGTAKTSSPMPTTTTTQGLPTTPPEDPTTTATNNYYNNSRGPTTTSSRGRTTTPHQDPTTAPALGGEAHLGIRTGDFHFCEEVDSPMLPHPLQLSAMHQAAAPGGRGETDTTSSTNGVDSVLTPHPSQGSSMYRVSAMTDPVSNSVDQASAPGDRGGHEETSFSNGMDSTTPHPSQGSSMCQASAMTYQVSTSVDEVPVPANVDNPTRAGRVQSPTAEKTTGKEASGRTSSDYGLDKRSFELAKEQAGAWRISEVEIDSFAGRMNSEQAKAVAVRRQLEAVKASLDGESMLSGLPNSNYRKATVPPVFSTIPSLDLAGGREPNKLIKVHIIELGSYKIKGASAPMPLVQVVSDILRGRKFPVSTKSQPACLVPASALLLSTDVQLGDAVSVFKLLRAAQ